jgi:hypothetical protein
MTRSSAAHWKELAASILLLTPVYPEAQEPQPPVIPIGDDAFLMWDRWPYQRVGVRAYMRSTYDRTGGNSDASNFLYQLADDYNVTLDVAGPGILYFTRFNHWHGSPWHFEVDGNDHIIRESSTADPTHPVEGSVFLPEKLFPAPLAVTWSTTRGADLSWIPIGFRHSLRLAYSHTFYGTGYYIYHQIVDGIPLSRPIPTWDGKNPPNARVLEFVNRAGTDVAPPAGTAGVVQATGQFDLPARSNRLVWTFAAGPAMVRALEFSVPRAQAVRFSDARLRITWDGRSAPSVDAPVALFYGAGVLFNRENREYLVKSVPMVIRYDRERVYLSCYFPMPFFRTARVELRGSDDSSIADVRWALRYAPSVDPPNQVGYFHATYRDHLRPKLGQDLVLLDTRLTEGGGDWSGSFIGTSFIFSHNAELSTLEGDPRFFFDDSQTPQAQGTGTEEWGGGGDYWGGENMTLAFAGHPVGALDSKKAVSAEDKIESAYRFLLADLMPFGKNATIRLEHGALDDSKEHYETVTYWYGLPTASVIKTDELVVGDKVSEHRHSYVSPGATQPYTLVSRYEWGPDHVAGTEIYPATADRGRTTTTTSEFTLNIDPKNVGVMLRRKLDYAYLNQRAEVYIKDARDLRADWQPAGIWYTAGSNTVVRSSGGLDLTKTFDLLAPLFSLMQRPDAVRAQIERDRELKVPAFIGALEALSALDRLPTRQELVTLETQTRGFLKVDGGHVLRVPPGVLAYATKLNSALQALLASDYESNMFEKAELGPTEHLPLTSNRRFRDDEFLVARALTQGRSSIRVRILFTPVRTPLYPGQPLPSLAWSEMRYTAYSFIVPRFTMP